MKVSTMCLEKIKEFEGFRAASYKDSAGVWTIGYGHTRGVRRGDVVSRTEAERLLRQDLAAVEAYVAGTGVASRQCRFDALADFAFNLGTVALESSTLLRKIRACAPDREVRAEFMRWVYCTRNGRKVKLEGLVKRRAWEAARYFNEV